MNGPMNPERELPIASRARETRRPASWRVGFVSARVWMAIVAIVALASCERTPSKSDYVSARVTELCRGKTSLQLQNCRIAVIKQFKDTPLEELQRLYPPPEPRPRPSCAL